MTHRVSFQCPLSCHLNRMVTPFLQRIEKNIPHARGSTGNVSDITVPLDILRRYTITITT